MNRSVKRVEESLRELGHERGIVWLDESARSAGEAAASLGCEVARIVKSLVFRTVGSEEPLLVLASGSNRVDKARVEAMISGPLQRPDAAFVKQTTGFSIGGVPPVGNSRADVHG